MLKGGPKYKSEGTVCKKRIHYNTSALTGGGLAPVLFTITLHKVNNWDKCYYNCNNYNNRSINIAYANDINITDRSVAAVEEN